MEVRLYENLDYVRIWICGELDVRVWICEDLHM